MMDKIIKFKTHYIVFLLFVIAIVPRIYRFSQQPIYTDEITWMVRAKETFLALRTFNRQHIKNYFQSSNAWWVNDNDTEAIALPLTAATGPFIAYLGIGQSVLTRNVARDFVVARFPLIVINSFTVVIVYLLTRKITDKKTALLTGVLYALDPVAISYSRLIINDGLLTLFILFGIYSFFYIENVKTSIILSSLSICFAFLTKPIGLLPLIIFFFYAIFSDKKMKNFIKFTLIGLVSFVLIHFFWPEAWFHPFTSVFEYLTRQFKLIENSTEMFFAGSVSHQVPFYYYFILICLRVPSYIFFGLLASLYFFFTKPGRKKLILINLKTLSQIIYVFVFFLFLSFASKKSGVRYLLPIWPYIYIGACCAIFRFVKKLPEIFGGFVLLAIISLSLFNIYKYEPNYDYYYNEIFGGPAVAKNYVSTSLCYGAKESADTLKKCFPQVTQISYVGCARSTLPYYFSGIINSQIDPNQPVVIEAYYEQMKYVTTKTAKLVKNKDVINVTKNGVDLAKIYLNLKQFPKSCSLN